MNNVSMHRLLLGLFLVSTAIGVNSDSKYKPVGDSDFKYRIMVDKVYCDENGILNDDGFQKIADMGFNVVVPRWHGGDISAIERNAGLAQKHGLYYMGWLRGSVPASYDHRNIYGTPMTSTREENTKKYGEPIKYVLKSGHTFDLLSPNSDELWKILGGYILNYAKLSKDLPIIGVLLDFEVYARPLPKEWPGHLYALSYDDKIMQEFAMVKELDFPNLNPSERANYLESKGLDKAFADFQINSWRKRLKKLRREIDDINPKFQIACYPSYYTLFVQEAVWKELGTEKAPLLSCEHYTYARGFPRKDKVKEYWRISDELGVRLNVDFLRNRNNMYESLKVPFKTLGGIDPICPGGEDPQFQAMSMVAMSEFADGYWIFYEGVKAGSPQANAFESWFNLANEAISSGSFDIKIKTE